MTLIVEKRRYHAPDEKYQIKYQQIREILLCQKSEDKSSGKIFSESRSR